MGVDSASVPLVSQLLSLRLIDALVVAYPDLQQQHLRLAGRFGSASLTGPLVDAAGLARDRSIRLDALTALGAVISRTRAALSERQVDVLLALAADSDEAVVQTVATILGSTELDAAQRQRVMETLGP
jgi:hypothetical protein